MYVCVYYTISCACVYVCDINYVCVCCTNCNFCVCVIMYACVYIFVCVRSVYLCVCAQCISLCVRVGLMKQLEKDISVHQVLHTETLPRQLASLHQYNSSMRRVVDGEALTVTDIRQLRDKVHRFLFYYYYYYRYY